MSQGHVTFIMHRVAYVITSPVLSVGITALREGHSRGKLARLGKRKEKEQKGEDKNKG